MTRILIGIPSFRRPQGLRKLLASLSAQEQVDGHNVEVFVADNDPERREASQVCDELMSSYRWPLNCRVVSEPGISAARNAILEEARARRVDFAAMLDDDEVAATNWLSEILDVRERFAADVVGGPMYYRFSENTPIGVIRCGVFVTPNRPEGILPLLSATPNILLRCARLEECDWPEFDLRFGLTGGEDREFLERLRTLEFRFAWAPMARTFEAVPEARTQARFILRRAFSNGNADIRIWLHHRQALGSALSLSKAVVLLVTAPIAALFLLVPSRRLWILAKWSRSLGKLAVLVGYLSDEYAAHRITGATF